MSRWKGWSPLQIAQHQTALAAARVWGMKYRASLCPPRAAVGGFPYRARTCAEWTDDEIDKRLKIRKRIRQRNAAEPIRRAA